MTIGTVDVPVPGQIPIIVPGTTVTVTAHDPGGISLIDPAPPAQIQPPALPAITIPPASSPWAALLLLLLLVGIFAWVR